jgi:hypothetical protein
MLTWQVNLVRRRKDKELTRKIKGKIYFQSAAISNRSTRREMKSNNAVKKVEDVSQFLDSFDAFLLDCDGTSPTIFFH